MAGYIGTKASVVSSGAERKKVFDITTTTTSLTGCSYTPNQVHVFHNGVRLVDGTDYTATDGSTVTLTTAAQNGDEVVVISYATFQTSDTVSASAGGTFSNAVTVNGLVTANRVGSDGTILDLKKDGTSVGAIGTNSSRITIGTNASGVRFRDSSGAERMEPWDMTLNSPRDAATNLGWSTVRWKDLYLSGGVYLGGTAGANLLNDYEYGDYQVSFTPSGGGSITVSGSHNDLKYTKIGSRVFVSGKVDISAASSPSGYIAVTLPFVIHNSGTANDSRRFNGSIWVTGTALSTYEYQLYGIEGESSVRIYNGSGNSMASTSANQFSGDEGVTFSFHYETTP